MFTNLFAGFAPVIGPNFEMDGAVSFTEDFTGVVTVADDGSGEWEHEAAAGSETVAQVDDVHGGVLRLTTGTTANNDAMVQLNRYAFVPAIGRRMMIGWRLRVEDISADQFCVGLHDQTNDFSGLISSGTWDGFGIYAAEGGDLKGFAGNGTTETTVDLGIDLADADDNEFFECGIALYTSADNDEYHCAFAVSKTSAGAKVVTLNTNGFIPETGLAPAAAIQTTDTGGDNLDIDKVAVLSER